MIIDVKQAKIIDTGQKWLEKAKRRKGKKYGKWFQKEWKKGKGKKGREP